MHTKKTVNEEQIAFAPGLALLVYHYAPADVAHSALLRLAARINANSDVPLKEALAIYRKRYYEALHGEKVGALRLSFDKQFNSEHEDAA